jgi:hypothetical protein
VGTVVGIGMMLGGCDYLPRFGMYVKALPCAEGISSIFCGKN